MKHYVGYLDNRRAECDAVNYIAAQHQAAMLLDTKRVHDIILIECTEPLCAVHSAGLGRRYGGVTHANSFDIGRIHRLRCKEDYSLWSFLVHGIRSDQHTDPRFALTKI